MRLMAKQRMHRGALGILFGLLAACGAKPPAAVTAPAVPAVDALEIGELKPGKGTRIVAGQKAVVEYTGWLYETSAPDKKGKEFDSSRSGGQPFSFVVGTGQVIKGWDQGVLGMQVGGRRRLTIPPDLAYGDVGAGGVIPPGAALIFDVELLAIQ
jgi:FKBP-type peptidyl-prolyl cis-trans isomerase